MDVVVHIFKNKTEFYNHQLEDKDFYDNYGKTYMPKEEHLEASIELLDEEFNDYSQIVNYDISPETFNSSRFAKANAVALETAIRLGADMHGIKLDSPFNIDQVVGIVVVLEGKIALDISGCRCFSTFQSIPRLHWLLLGAMVYPPICICTKREDETYREYAERRALEKAAAEMHLITASLKRADLK